MLDHDVFPIIRVTGDEVGVHDLSVANGAHFIEGFATRIAVQSANIDSFVKAGVNQACRRLNGIAHESVLAAFPWRRFHSVVVTLDVLIECGTIAREKSVVIRWQDEVDRLMLHLRDQGGTNQQKSECRGGETNSHARRVLKESKLMKLCSKIIWLIAIAHFGFSCLHIRDLSAVCDDLARLTSEWENATAAK